jgi:NAD(P)-dependent dehydrogenase (short-subunit alcohol dehydrogenase family)
MNSLEIVPIGAYKMNSDKKDRKKDRKRIALVTGANRGLGFETCHQLALLGHTVILIARDFTKGEIAAKQLIERALDELDVLNQSHMTGITRQIEQHLDS